MAAPITTATFKTYRGITVSTYDALIATLVAGCIAKVQRFLDRTLATATFTEKHNGKGAETIILRNPPITSITSITLTHPDGYSEVVDSDLYTYQADNGVVKFDPAGMGRVGGSDWWWPDGDSDIATWDVAPQFPEGHQNITVVYVGGYATYDDDLILAMFKYVDLLYADSYAVGGSPTGFKSEHLGDYDYEKADWTNQFMAVGDKIVDLKEQQFISLFTPFKTGGWA